MPFTPIPEGAAATPSTFNSRFQELDTSINQAFAGAAAFITGQGNPQGQVAASPGTIYIDFTQVDRIYFKVIGSGASGWRFAMLEAA